MTPSPSGPRVDRRVLLATATATAGVTAAVAPLPAGASPVDVQPTVGEIFGLRPPRGGYDGSSRL